MQNLDTASPISTELLSFGLFLTRKRRACQNERPSFHRMRTSPGRSPICSPTRAALKTWVNFCLLMLELDSPSSSGMSSFVVSYRIEFWSQDVVLSAPLYHRQKAEN